MTQHSANGLGYNRCKTPQSVGLKNHVAFRVKVKEVTIYLFKSQDHVTSSGPRVLPKQIRPLCFLHHSFTLKFKSKPQLAYQFLHAMYPLHSSSSMVTSAYNKPTQWTHTAALFLQYSYIVNFHIHIR